MLSEASNYQLPLNDFKYGHKQCLIEGNLLIQLDNKPLLMLVGTERIVKSKAQVFYDLKKKHIELISNSGDS